MTIKIKAPKGLRQIFIPLLVLISIGLAFFGGVMWQKVKNLEKGGTAQVSPQPTQPKVALNQIKDLFKKDLVKFGDEKRKVLFVEISDPSCPYCNAAAGLNPELNIQIDEGAKKNWTSNYPGKNPNDYASEWKRFTLVSSGGSYLAPVAEMKKLVDSGQASFIFIYSPGHGNGEMGTKALYCAFEKGKFWEVSDLLMTNKGYNLLNNTLKNDKTKSQDLATFLKSAVDSAFLKECLDSGKYDSRLASDAQLATTLGFQGTPHFFVNDQAFPGAYNWVNMKPVVDAALK